MGSDMSRTVSMQSHGGGRKIRLNIDSAYAEYFQVDVSEVFASAFLFAAGTPKGLHAKLEKIFALFDFDGNGGLGEVESEIMLECVVRGVSRVALMPQPEDVLDSIEKLTASLFNLSKRQAGAGDLTLGDLKDWISEREDVAAFLTNFTQARMIISSLEVESVGGGLNDLAVASAPEND